MTPADTDERDRHERDRLERDWRGPALRAAAFAAAVLLPTLWLASLRGDPVLLTSNVARVVGGAMAAGAAWFVQHRGGGGTPSWQTFLVAGVVGSVAVAVMSLVVPVFGRLGVSGWIASGVIGGGSLALVVYGMRGRVGDGVRGAVGDGTRSP